MKVIGIVDEPVPKGGEDTLSIKKYSDALTEFIKLTSTPLTIGVQGEWGSGKTSMLNAIFNELENDKYIQIWINSWEHSLQSNPEESLLKIINDIIFQLLENDKIESVKNSNNIKNVAAKFMKGALRVGASVSLGNTATDVIDEFLDEGTNPIKKLRDELTSLSDDIYSGKNPIEKIIIYVDDLDRIEPHNAVRILELLKNIFSIPNCVFVLAIDYQVIVKGLKDKFGERTEENEWEFRAFFDKIIQLPFMMPMDQYSIGKYVSTLLNQIGFIENESQFEQDFETITSYTIGGNPRSIKRLINSLALINIFSRINDEKEKDNKNKKSDYNDTLDILLFSIVCLQIAYPKLYDLLIEYPIFSNWDESFAKKVTPRLDEESEKKFNEELKLAEESFKEDFDEKWEKVLYRICYPTPIYKARVSEISKFFSYLKDELLKVHKDKLKSLITQVINSTLVTSINTKDDSQIISSNKYQKVTFENFHELIEYKFEQGKINEEIALFIRNVYEYLSTDIRSNINFKFSPSYLSIYKNGKAILAINHTKSSITIEHRQEKLENTGIKYLEGFDPKIEWDKYYKYYKVKFEKQVEFDKCKKAIKEYLHSK